MPRNAASHNNIINILKLYNAKQQWFSVFRFEQTVVEQKPKTQKNEK